MDYLEAMQEPHSNDDLLNDDRCIFFLQIPIVLHKLKQILASHELGYDVDMGFCLDALFELE